MARHKIIMVAQPKEKHSLQLVKHTKEQIINTSSLGTMSTLERVFQLLNSNK